MALEENSEYLRPYEEWKSKEDLRWKLFLPYLLTNNKQIFI